MCPVYPVDQNYLVWKQKFCKQVLCQIEGTLAMLIVHSDICVIIVTIQKQSHLYLYNEVL